MRRGSCPKYLRGAAVLLGALAAALVPAVPPAEAGGGKVRIVRNATSSFDSVIVDSSARERHWMARHYWRMRGYAPFFNRALNWAPSAHLYKDLYAIYRDRAADRELLARHPSWVLRDSLGRPLYIPWECTGGSCTQFAADIGNPQWRAHWIAEARERIRQGYAGIHVDDVNMLMRVGDGSGTFVRPFDPRTGAPMTDANWRRYVAEFTEQIKAAFPAKEIVHNAIWWLDRSDAYVQRQVDAADFVQLERGFNDAGIVGGSRTFGYENFLAYVDWIHSRGSSVMYEPYGLKARSRRFELASYFLARGKRDAIVPAHRADPGDWWRGWTTRLGGPLGRRYEWRGVFRRDFRLGTAFVNPPEAPARTVKLPARRWRDSSGKRVRRLVLGERAGKVLTTRRGRR